MKKIILSTLLGLVASTSFAQSPGALTSVSTNKAVESGFKLCWQTKGNGINHCYEGVKAKEVAAKEEVEKKKAREEALRNAVVVTIGAPQPPKPPKKITLSSKVTFYTGSANIEKDIRTQIEDLVEQYELKEIIITGHADKRGGDSPANRKLSQERANAFKKVLTNMGVPESNFVLVEGLSISVPIVECKPVTDDCEIENRRVQMRAIGIERK